MKKHLFLKSLLIAIGLLVASINTAWADCQVTNTDFAQFYNSVTSSSLSLTNDDNNHYYGNLYVKGGTEYERKWVVGKNNSWSNWYKQDRDTNPSGNYDGTVCLNTGDGNDKFTTPGTTSDFKKLYIDLWCSYSWGSRVKFYYEDVSSLSPSLSASSTSISGGATSSLSASCTGGSGGYTYTYSCRNTTDGVDATSALSATSGTSVTFTGPVNGSAKTYRITVTAQDANSQLRNLGFSTQTAYKDITVAATVTPAITLTSVSPSSSIVAGNDITLVGTRANSSNTISFEYTTNDGSTWTAITPKSSSLSSNTLTAVWTVPDAHGVTQTFKFRAKLAEASPIYSSKSNGVTVYNTKTIHVRNTNNWASMYVYAWDGSGDITSSWHGNTGNTKTGGFSCTNTRGQWWDVVITSRTTGFILNGGGSGNPNQTVNLLYTGSGSVSHDTYYTMSTGGSNKQTLSSTTAPAKPSVTTGSVSVKNLTSLTLPASGVANNGDDITAYGFKYGTTSDCSDGTVSATNLSSGSFSKQVTGLSVGTTYYYKAYATNAFGTTYGTVQNATTTLATLSLAGTADYVNRAMTITPTTNMNSTNGFSGTYYVCCTCTSKPVGAADPTITWNGTTKKLDISNADDAGDYTFNVKLKAASNCSGAAYNNADDNITITMKDIPDYSGKTPTTAIVGTTYMNGSGTSVSPYFVYSSHFNDAKTLTLSISGVGTSDAVYCAVDGANEQSMSGSGTTSRTATITLPSSSVGANKTTTVTVYAKVDGQTPAAAKKASLTVYYTVNTDPVVTVTATYNDETIAGEIPQNAEIELSASVTQIPGEPTFTYSMGSGAYTSTTTYTMDVAGTTTMHAKTTYLGDWIGNFDITTYAANQVTCTTSKTDMYGDVAVSSTTRLFNSNGEEYTAASIEGYTFTGWTCSNSNVQVSDNGSTWKSTSSNATVYVKATAAGGTLTASYTEKKRIYFDNSKAKWTGKIYVYIFNGNAWYDNYSTVDHNGPGVVPKLSTKVEYGQMTQIGQSDIYYYEYTYGSSFTNVAFSIGDQHNYDLLYNTKGVWRTDFSACNPCYVAPATHSEVKYNTGGPGKSGDNKPTYYYNTGGYWRRYMPRKSGYTLHFADQEVAFLPENPNVDAENFKVTVLRNAGTTYPIYVNNSCMSKTWKNSSAITKDNCSNLTLTQTSGTCNFTTTANGDYVFHLSTANGTVKLTVEYPLSKGDYQVYYTDNTGNNNNYSNYIRKNTSGSAKKDTVSFFVKKANSPTFQIKRCTGFTGSTPDWENVGSATAISVAKDSVYNLIFEQNGTGTTISKVGQEFYSGDYYIRTDGAPGGWQNYLSDPGNKLKHTDKASALAAGYNYYFVKWIGDANGNSTANVKFCIATDYNNCVSQEHGNDPADGSLSGKQYLTGKGANVRFTYHPGTNTTTRTCVGGSGHDNQYLVINGTHLKKSDNTEWAGRTKMVDTNDWIYTFELKAADDATISLESHYNDKFVTILPPEKVLDVNDALYYDLRIVYDYKTNEVVAAYVPGTVSSELSVDVDIMFIRQAKDNHEDAPTTTLTLTGSGKITGNPKTLYGAIKFEKNYVRAEGDYIGLVTRRPERSTYWISFPFDVRVKDIFGLGEYTETWILQRYRGDQRASKGWFLDTKTFWEYIMDTEYVLKAGEGYVLSLDCEAIQWPNNQTTQYLYFPSKNKITDITSVLPSSSLPVPEHECTITSPADRTIKDSHWNVIGIPGFADAWGNAKDNVTTIGGDLKYFYTWTPSTNTLSTTSSRKYNFKFMHSYMVQYHGNIDWSASEPAAIAARRAPNAKPEEVEFCLVLMQGEDKADNTFVTLMDNEQITNNFDQNADLVKMFNSKKANIYTIIGEDVQVAANCLPMVEQTAVVPVGVQIATTGEYTFSIPEGTEGIGVTLIDNETGIRTSLSAVDYTINLSAGTYDERFILEISPIKNTPTGIDLLNGENGANGVRKVMVDGMLYIVKDGKVFDAQGRQVK